MRNEPRDSSAQVVPHLNNRSDKIERAKDDDSKQEQHRAQQQSAQSLHRRLGGRRALDADAGECEDFVGVGVVDGLGGLATLGPLPPGNMC